MEMLKSSDLLPQLFIFLEVIILKIIVIVERITTDVVEYS